MTLGEDLELMLRSRCHYVEYAADVVVGDGLVEQVAHRVDENSSRLVPEKRSGQAFRPEAEIEALLVWMAGHASEPLSERLGVAVSTSG